MGIVFVTPSPLLSLMPPAWAPSALPFILPGPDGHCPIREPRTTGGYFHLNSLKLNTSIPGVHSRRFKSSAVTWEWWPPKGTAQSRTCPSSQRVVLDWALGTLAEFYAWAALGALGSCHLAEVHYLTREKAIAQDERRGEAPLSVTGTLSEPEKRGRSVFMIKENTLLAPMFPVLGSLLGSFQKGGLLQPLMEMLLGGLLQALEVPQAKLRVKMGLRAGAPRQDFSPQHWPPPPPAPAPTHPAACTSCPRRLTAVFTLSLNPFSPMSRAPTLPTPAESKQDTPGTHTLR